MDDLRCALREIHGGAVAKRLLADILCWAERDGVLERMRRLSHFTEADLCRCPGFRSRVRARCRESATHDLAPPLLAWRVWAPAGGGVELGLALGRLEPCPGVRRGVTSGG